VSVTVCPYCGVSFPRPPGADLRQARCPRCGRALAGPKAGPSPWLIVGLVLFAFGLLFVLGLVVLRFVIEGGAERLPGLLTGAAGLLR
jgi:hypothetical protein